MMDLGKLLVFLLACCVLPVASGVCFNGTLSAKEFHEMTAKGCSNAGETLHVQQDQEFKLHVVCSPVFTCAKGTYAYVDVEKCRVLCKICQEDHFQPEEKNTDKFAQPHCINRKNRCNQDTKMTCQPSSPEQDDECQCDWRKGYRPATDSCRIRCYTESDKNCGLCVKDSICKEGEELNATYHCIPSMVKPCAASPTFNPSAPGLNDATTPVTTKSTSSPTTSTRSVELLRILDRKECHCPHDTWCSGGVVFFVLFIICFVIIVIIVILIGLFLWKRWNSKKRPRRQLHKQQEATTPMMTLDDAQHPADSRIAELTKKIEDKEMTNKTNKALRKESQDSHTQKDDQVKLVMDADSQEEEVPDEVEESTTEIKKQVSRKHPRQPKYQNRTSRESASEDEMESPSQKTSREKKLKGQDLTPTLLQCVPSSSSYEEEISMALNVTPAAHNDYRQQEAEGAVGGADNQEQSSALGLA